jgi:hypothetical protein
MNTLTQSIPTGYDQDHGASYVAPDQNPIIKRLNPFINMPLPAPGYWLMRFVRLGPWVPCAIMRLRTQHEPGNEDNKMERSPFLAAYISGEVVALEDIAHRRGRRIAPEEYWQAVGEIQRARARNEYDPRLHPRKPVNLGAINVD